MHSAFHATPPLLLTLRQHRQSRYAAHDFCGVDHLHVVERGAVLEPFDLLVVAVRGTAVDDES